MRVSVLSVSRIERAPAELSDEDGAGQEDSKERLRGHFDREGPHHPDDQGVETFARPGLPVQSRPGLVAAKGARDIRANYRRPTGWPTSSAATTSGPISVESLISDSKREIATAGIDPSYSREISTWRWPTPKRDSRNHADTHRSLEHQARRCYEREDNFPSFRSSAIGHDVMPTDPVEV